MNTGKKYKTKQREQILECIRHHARDYITIQELSGILENKNNKIGLTTIYRYLEQLEKENEIAKVSIDGIKGCCYRYLSQSENRVLFYLKCEKCGKMVEIKCPELGGLYQHISKDHHIYINPSKTMFYGTCDSCTEKNEEIERSTSNGTCIQE